MLSGGVRFILALALLMVAGTVLVIGMWQAPLVPLQRPMSAASRNSKGMIGGAWIGVVGTLLGAVIGFAGAWLLKYGDDRRKRQVLATGLLSEIRLLELSLRDIHGDPTAAYRVMEPFQTAVYDQAGANLLLFQSETMRALNVFYNGIHELRTTLTRARLQYPDPQALAQRYPPQDQGHTCVRCIAANVHDAIRAVVTQLSKHEGGQQPGTLPPFRVRLAGSQLDVPELGPSPFEDQP